MTTASTNTTPRSTPLSAWRAKIAELDARYDRWCGTQEARILSVVATAILVLITAIVLFGYPALIVAALAAVPVCFTMLMLITVGK